MTDSSNGFHPLPYRLGMTGPAKDEYRHIGIEAVDAGLARSQLRAILRQGKYGLRRLDIFRAFERLLAKLKEAPRECGDPLVTVHGVKAMVLRGLASITCRLGPKTATRLRETLSFPALDPVNGYDLTTHEVEGIASTPYKFSWLEAFQHDKPTRHQYMGSHNGVRADLIQAATGAGVAIKP